uniref:ATP-dependent helicase C-terminal domain-containing protein n=1 Tax=Megaselia scalaris TaxID=36166 RepID=T1H1N9_MEGSC
MRPTDDLINQIFCSSKHRVKEFIYDHVVPKTSILPIILCKGPTGKTFQFKYNQRSDPTLMKELGMTLFNLCNIIPAGIICFFNSYDYLKQVYDFLNNEKFLEKIEKKKFILCEPKGGSGSNVDTLLDKYSKSIRSSERSGALLLSVVGGKLSEGLNFSDDLGRCVVVVGMPY